jgi:Na+/phosphate symporter
LGASNFYINILGDLQDMAQSLEYIGKVSHNHVNNNHKKLKYNQIKELKEIDLLLEEILNNTREVFETETFDKLGEIIDRKQELFGVLSQKIEKQVARTRTEESSPKNTTLYFSLLLETKDFVTATMNLLEQYREAHKGTNNPIIPSANNPLTP